MKAAVIQFPGSNCDLDMINALQLLEVDATLVSHKATSLVEYDAIFLPGGFSFGDYLRCGAIARFSPIMAAVTEAANAGKLVVGVCNGFQILTEAGLLPGQLMMNETPGFICDEVPLTVTNRQSQFTNQYETDTITLPVAHGEGRYYADSETVASLEENQQVIFRYQSNVNGSVNQIAGIVNEQGNVLGMMPHPERAVEAIIGNICGQPFFKSLLNQTKNK